MKVYQSQVNLENLSKGIFYGKFIEDTIRRTSTKEI